MSPRAVIAMRRCTELWGKIRATVLHACLELPDGLRLGLTLLGLVLVDRRQSVE
jgi:hypothetical protein